MNIRACLCVDACRQVNPWFCVHPWLICLCLLFIACSKSTDPDTGSIRGKVLLEGQTDHSGAKVSLYLPAELDPEIVELKQSTGCCAKYPNVGVPISQHSEFDHRLSREVASTRTGKDGSFELKDVGEGEYILVAQKKATAGGISSISRISHHVSRITLSLSPEAHVTVPKGVTLTIPYGSVYEFYTDEPGAWVRFDGYYKLKVEGRLNALGQPDNMITFTLDRGSLVRHLSSGRGLLVCL